MNKEHLIASVIVLTIFVGTLNIFAYIKSQNSKEMVKMGLEECLKVPNQRNSASIWVKDCGTYMENWKKAQDN